MKHIMINYKHISETKHANAFLDTESFVFSINTCYVIIDLQNPNELFDYSNLNKNHEIISIKNRKFFW